MKELIKITEYNLKDKLPNPFVFDDGNEVKSADDWKKRRKEIFKTAVELQYGGVLPEPEVLKVEPLYVANTTGALSTYRITTGKKDKTVSFNMIVFKAKLKEKTPCAVSGDLCFPYAFDKEYRNTFIDNGISLVMFNRTDLFPDIAGYNIHDAMKEGTKEFDESSDVLKKLEKGEACGALADIYPECTFGAVSAWAWGYSRCVDALEYLGFADMDCIAFTGHSRGAKTAMLAGVLDERAAIVNPNATCAGGCSCYRLNIKAVIEDGVTESVSEPLSNIFHHFPMWLGQGMREYIDNEEKLPFDSHYLKAMVAPRVLFVSEAASDIWANPVGSWQTTVAAKEVYKFLGKEENIVWYFRSGTHKHDIEDVSQLVNVIRNYKWGEKLNDKFFKTPFKEPEYAFDWCAPNKE